MNHSADLECLSEFPTTLPKLFATSLILIKLQPDLPTQFRNKDPHTAPVLCCPPSRSDLQSAVLTRGRRALKHPHIPAHLVEEAVRFGHTVQLVFVLLQQIDVTLLGYKLQQLRRRGKKKLYSDV